MRLPYRPQGREGDPHAPVAAQRNMIAENHDNRQRRAVSPSGSYAGELRRIGELLGRGQWRTALHRASSLRANFWNYEVRGKTKRVECPCCGWQGPAFVSLSNWRAVQHNSRCPNCDSRSRHRGLTIMLPKLLAGMPDGPMLVFAPEASLLELVRRHARGGVETTDYLMAEVDHPGEDIQALSFADNNYAALMCNHVLEHIPDDRAALAECARVLMPGAIAVFTIPGDYDQGATRYLDTPDANGHLRHYGLDVVDKMRAAFGRVEAMDMSVGADPRWHIHPGDMAFVCYK